MSGPDEPLRWPPALRETARSNNGRWKRTRAQAEWDADVADRVERGDTFRQIAADLGYASPSSAYEAYQRAIRDAIRPKATEVLTTQLGKLDHLYRVALAVLESTHLVVSNGRVVSVENLDGQRVPVVDAGPVLAALDRCLKIEEQRTKLLGNSAPTRVDIRRIPEEDIDAEIARLLGDLDDLRDNEDPGRPEGHPRRPGGEDPAAP